MGNNKNEVDNSIFNLKHREYERLSLMPTSEAHESNGCEDSQHDDLDNDFDLENLTLGHLCGDLMEEVMDEDSDHLSCDYVTIFKNNKSRKSKNKSKIRVIKKTKRSKK